MLDITSYRAANGTALRARKPYTLGAAADWLNCLTPDHVNISSVHRHQILRSAFGRDIDPFLQNIDDAMHEAFLSTERYVKYMMHCRLIADVSQKRSISVWLAIFRMTFHLRRFCCRLSNFDFLHGLTDRETGKLKTDADDIPLLAPVGIDAKHFGGAVNHLQDIGWIEKVSFDNGKIYAENFYMALPGSVLWSRYFNVLWATLVNNEEDADAIQAYNAIVAFLRDETLKRSGMFLTSAQ